MKNLFLLSPLLLTANLPLPARPPTLIELTGGPAATPPLLSASVVLVIDAQREYTEGRLPLAGVQGALVQTRRLLLRARKAGVPIIHIRQISAPGLGLFDPTGPLVAFAPESAPLAGETIVTKRLPNAFAGTTLQAELKKLGRTQLIISGYMTHMCVSATARAALDLGYRTTIIADACATRDLPDGDDVIPAATVHRTALAELGDRFSSIIRTLDDLPQAGPERVLANPFYGVR